MSKNRKKRSRANRPSQGKSQGLALIKKTLRDLRLDIATLARNARQWWRETHGRVIKAGHVKEVIHAFRRNTLTPPKWLTEYVARGLSVA